MSFAALMKRQRAWARSRQLTLEGVCLPSMDDNLFRPLHPETFRELTAGSGNELGIPGQRYRPKIRSIRSSSVFALNIFDYWRSRDLEPLAGALGVEGHFTSLQFERKAPHGLASEPPHLDVALTPDIRAPLLGIECKFAELYDRKNNKPGTVDAKYFGVMPGRWENLGLPRCQRLAEELGQSIDYHRLHAGQLLKHILGLAHSADREGRKGRVRLLYLWYDTETTEADAHREQVNDFLQHLDPSIEFRALTFQKLLPRLAKVGEPEYIEYLQARYSLLCP